MMVNFGRIKISHQLKMIMDYAEKLDMMDDDCDIRDIR